MPKRQTGSKAILHSPERARRALSVTVLQAKLLEKRWSAAAQRAMLRALRTSCKAGNVTADKPTGQRRRRMMSWVGTYSSWRNVGGWWWLCEGSRGGVLPSPEGTATTVLHVVGGLERSD